MPDYNELRKKLKEFLATQTKKDLETWLEMDRKRMLRLRKESIK